MSLAVGESLIAGAEGDALSGQPKTNNSRRPVPRATPSGAGRLLNNNFFLGRVYAQTSVPNELLEAARIDGASEARIFFTIVLRILAPAMVTIFLFLFVATWNNFLLPLMMVSSDTLKPVTLGLYGMVSLATFTDRGALMMGALLGVLPVIVLFLGLQRYWQAGLAAGAVKG